MSEAKLNIIRPENLPGALILEFDNQSSLNAFTIKMWQQLVSALRSARRDDSVRVVVLRGAGDKAFSSGLSMEDLNTLKCDDDYAIFYSLGVEIRECIFTMGKPVISAVKGFCVGGGLEITLCCDLVYAAEGSKFALPEIGIGLVPGCGGAIHLPEKIPVNRAMEMILFSEKITAEEAKSWGLVNRIFPVETFDEELEKIIAKLLSKPALAIKGLKELMAHTSVAGDESAALKVERKLSIDLMNTYDFKEAITAFQEKRKPEFKGM